MHNSIYALDTENYYDAELSITTMGAWKYTRASENYMLTIAGSDGLKYAGNPKDFDWGILRGKTIVMANAGYDLTVLEAEGEKGNIPKDLGFKEVVDVLDMSRYMGRPGSLAGASQSLLGIEVDKKTRANMKGKQWETMSEEFKKEVTDYALKDAEMTLKLWLDFGHKWPWHERELSRQTREIGMRGVPVDVKKAEQYKKHLEGLIWNAEQSIPWAKEEDAKILSPKALAEECRKVGIEPPKSLAVDSEECQRWEDKYGETYPWVGAMRDWRRCNMLLKKVCTFINRTKPDGWMPFSLKYFGAGSTGRWSGDAGLNLQNLNRKELYGVDLRGLIKAPEGTKIVSVDLSQIEPRCLAFLAGDTPLIEYIRQSDDLYDAQARAWGLHEGPDPLRKNPAKRLMVKQLNLGLGYGMSAGKFTMVSGVEVAEAERLTTLFRTKNPKLKALWKTLETSMKRHASRGADFSLELPSGREITYWSASNAGGGLTAVTCRNGKMMRSKYWYGLLVENLTQATAREVFAEKLLNIEASGHTILFSVHDEVVCLTREKEAEQSLKNIVEIMSETPEWMPGLPLAAEGSIEDKYGK
jgi:DNA polymerase I-like protein with 3'-5' exonuclease and polymerase domains